MNYKIFIANILLLTLLIGSCSETPTALTPKEKPVVVDDSESKALDEAIENSRHNKTAKFLAGITHYQFSEDFAFPIEEWNIYSSDLNESWKKMEETRINPIQDFTQSTIAPNINDTLPLYYPFSGPDFLHASSLFPNASNYLMLAREGIGELPDFEQMDEQGVRDYIKNVNLFLRDIYKRSYFITKNMDGDMHGTTIKGILPILYVFIARAGYDIIDVERITLNDQGKVLSENNASKGLDGVRFKVRGIESKIAKEVVYWDCDLSDDGLMRTPELATYLSNIGDCNTFVKSASYLMHYGTFNAIREQVLQTSMAVLQDDTGVPYKYFGESNWKCKLFGEYKPPIVDFSSKLWQKDLNLAYQDESKYSGKLPFSLGYHWGEKGHQNYMLYYKAK